MIAPALDTSIQLPDARRLAFAEYGDPAGEPVFLFHGLPGSRLAWSFLPSDWLPAGLRIVAPDRLGYGGSDPNPGRTLLEWADDVSVLADNLQIDRFRVVGVSGGGPGALACAYKLPQRLERADVVAGAAPTDARGVFVGMSRVNRFFIKLAWRAPLLSTLNVRFLAAIIRHNPARHIDTMQRKVHAVDRTVLAEPGIRDMLVRDFTEALRQGAQGMIDDMAANHGHPWGFAPSDIQVKTHFWYGALDRSVPPAMGQYLANATPKSEFHLIQDAGHLWALHNLGEVLHAATRRDSPAPSFSAPVLEK